MCCETPDTSVSSANSAAPPDKKQTETEVAAVAEQEETLGNSSDISPSNTCSNGAATQIDHNNTAVIDDQLKKIDQVEAWIDNNTRGVIDDKLEKIQQGETEHNNIVVSDNQREKIQQEQTENIYNNTAVIEDQREKIQQEKTLIHYNNLAVIQQEDPVKSNGGVKRSSTGSFSNIRSIPITIEVENCSDKEHIDVIEKSKKNDQSIIKERSIPIEIITEVKNNNDKQSSEKENKASTNMSSIRTIPIQRMSSGSSCESSSFSSSLPKTSSRESLNTSSQKIKMGTAAIRIPIQIQKSNDSVDNNVQGREKKLQPDIKLQEVSASKPPQSVRTVPILRQSLSDSGVIKVSSSTNKQGSRSRNVSAQSDQSDRLQKVHEELEVRRLSKYLESESLNFSLKERLFSNVLKKQSQRPLLHLLKTISNTKYSTRIPFMASLLVYHVCFSIKVD